MVPIEDIDIAQVVKDAQINIPATQKSYSVYIKKFRVALKQKEDTPIVAEFMTDDNIASFLFTLGNFNNHGPCHLKGASAALGTELVRLELPGIYTSKHQYPRTAIVIKVKSI
jgi:hypothetical protein